jgi:radical SAM superfamily enzyme YgiQ (UPF0313 family)
MIVKTDRVLLVLCPVSCPQLPPLGLGFLQAYLARSGVNADILDLNNYFYNRSGEYLRREWRRSCNVRLEESMVGILSERFAAETAKAVDRISEYDIAGFSCFKSNFPVAQWLSRLVKEKRRDCRIVWGGPEMNRLYSKGGGMFIREAKKTADFVVIGEGERPLLRYAQGRLRGGVEIFDELPASEFAHYPEYSDGFFKGYPKRGAAALQWSRGCARSCSFCSERLLTKKFKQRPVDNLIAEIGDLRDRHGISSFIFFDSMVNTDTLALELLCDRIIGEFGSIPWEAQIGIRSDMPQRVFEKMKRCGCYNLFVGLESGCDRTLRRMRKGFSTADAVRFFSQLRRADLSFGVSLIVGFPGETMEDFEQSVRFVLENKNLIAKVEQINPFTYYDGTSVPAYGDYRYHPEVYRRFEFFVEVLRHHKIRITRAFIGNLMDKHDFSDIFRKSGIFQ